MMAISSQYSFFNVFLGLICWSNHPRFFSCHENAPNGLLGPHLVPEFNTWDCLVEVHQTSLIAELNMCKIGLKGQFTTKLIVYFLISAVLFIHLDYFWCESPTFSCLLNLAFSNIFVFRSS